MPRDRPVPNPGAPCWKQRVPASACACVCVCVHVRACWSQDLQPPKHLYIEVRVLQDYGDVVTASGSVTLKKGERLLLKRSDIEHLIRQGVLEETGR